MLARAAAFALSRRLDLDEARASAGPRRAPPAIAREGSAPVSIGSVVGSRSRQRDEHADDSSAQS